MATVSALAGREEPSKAFGDAVEGRGAKRSGQPNTPILSPPSSPVKTVPRASAIAVRARPGGVPGRLAGPGRAVDAPPGAGPPDRPRRDGGHGWFGLRGGGRPARDRGRVRARPGRAPPPAVGHLPWRLARGRRIPGLARLPRDGRQALLARRPAPAELWHRGAGEAGRRLGGAGPVVRQEARRRGAPLLVRRPHRLPGAARGGRRNPRRHHRRGRGVRRDPPADPPVPGRRRAARDGGHRPGGPPPLPGEGKGGGPGARPAEGLVGGRGLRSRPPESQAGPQGPRRPRLDRPRAGRPVGRERLGPRLPDRPRLATGRARRRTPIATPPAADGRRLPPPDLHPEPLRDPKNQEPVPGGPAGVEVSTGGGDQASRSTVDHSPIGPPRPGGAGGVPPALDRREPRAKRAGARRRRGWPT